MATQVTAAQVKEFAPEMDAQSDTRVELFIEYAENWVDEGQWGRKYVQAIILMTCHLLTIAGRTGSSGSVTAEKVGDLSVSYGATDPADGLSVTSYGQLFQQLKRTIKKTPLVV